MEKEILINQNSYLLDKLNKLGFGDMEHNLKECSCIGQFGILLKTVREVFGGANEVMASLYEEATDIGFKSFLSSL